MSPVLNVRTAADLENALAHAAQYAGQAATINRINKDKYEIALADGTVIARTRGKGQAEAYLALIPAEAPKVEEPATAYGAAKAAWSTHQLVANPEHCWYAPTGGRALSAVQTLHIHLAAATQELGAVTIAEALTILGDHAANSHPETIRKLAGEAQVKLLAPFGWEGERTGSRGSYAYAIRPAVACELDLVAHAARYFPAIRDRIEAVRAARLPEAATA